MIRFVLRRCLPACLLVALCLPARGEDHPRLFITAARLAQVREAVRVDGSHHREAFLALKERVDRQDLALFGATAGNQNYARAYLAQCAAFLYQVTGDSAYAGLAFRTVSDIFHKPDAEGRLPHSESFGDRKIDTKYGLSRATVGLGLAYAYDWCYTGWTDAQRGFVKNNLNVALDAWQTYRHANLESEHRGSNWVAVCRGGELVMMLAAYEDRSRPQRFRFLKNELRLHLENGYGPTGFTQEGIGYCAYAGLYLLPAVYALQSVGDTALQTVFNRKQWWKWAMYAGSFVFKSGNPTVLQSGVAGDYGDGQGWMGLLLRAAPPQYLPYYVYFYDRFSGRLAPVAPARKYEPHRAGTVWSLLYYPEGLKAEVPDPKDGFTGLHDAKAGVSFFRNRWQDENDIHLSVMADITHHGHAWDQAEALQLVLNGLGSQFVRGPGKNRDPALFSALLVNGLNHQPPKGSGHTGTQGYVRFNPDGGGYVVAGGGQKYDSLGVKEVKRHVQVSFSVPGVPAVVSVLDDIRADRENTYTWNLNLGKVVERPARPATGRQADGVPVFTVPGKGNARLRGWVLHPADARVRVVTVQPEDQAEPAYEALQVVAAGKDEKIWVVMALGTDLPPLTAKGTGKRKTFYLGKTKLEWAPGQGQVNPGSDF